MEEDCPSRARKQKRRRLENKMCLKGPQFTAITSAKFWRGLKVAQTTEVVESDDPVHFEFFCVRYPPCWRCLPGARVHRGTYVVVTASESSPRAFWRTVSQRRTG